MNEKIPAYEALNPTQREVYDILADKGPCHRADIAKEAARRKSEHIRTPDQVSFTLTALAEKGLAVKGTKEDPRRGSEWRIASHPPAPGDALAALARTGAYSPASAPLDNPEDCRDDDSLRAILAREMEEAGTGLEFAARYQGQGEAPFPSLAQEIEEIEAALSLFSSGIAHCAAKIYLLERLSGVLHGAAGGLLADIISDLRQLKPRKTTQTLEVPVAHLRELAEVGGLSSPTTGN